jgi:hypothetical protein
MAQSVVDEEKGIQSPPTVETSLEEAPKDASVGAGSPTSSGFFSSLNARLNSMKLFESRGVERVPVEERHDIRVADYMQMTLLWFSTNITANNIAVGMLGPLSYDLGFVDSALCATFGALLGAAGVAYMGTFGPASGNRTMVCL